MGGRCVEDAGNPELPDFEQQRFGVRSHVWRLGCRHSGGIPSMSRVMAVATATILQWVPRSAPMSEWVISGSLPWGVHTPRTNEGLAFRQPGQLFFGYDEAPAR